MSAKRDELVAALRALERKHRAGTPLERRDARAVLIPLGELFLGTSGEAELEGALAEVRAAVEPLEERWSTLVASELALACAEHIRSVDPRHLEHPLYDFAYTLAARSRLEARLVGVRRLGLPLPRALVEEVERADRRLAPWLDRARAEGRLPDQRIQPPIKNRGNQ